MHRHDRRRPRCEARARRPTAHSHTGRRCSLLPDFFSRLLLQVPHCHPFPIDLIELAREVRLFTEESYVLLARHLTRHLHNVRIG